MGQEVYEQIAQKVTDYICSLPNGSRLTLEDAVKASCPEEFDKLDLLNYSLLSTVEDKVNKTDTVIDFSEHDNMREGLPYNMDFYIWQKRLQNVRIISDLLCYGPMPAPDDPVEQHLTISFSGRVWFTEYVFGQRRDNGRKLSRKINCYIGKAKTARMLSYIADYFESNPFPEYMTDVGSWEMKANWIDGTKRELSGSMHGDISVGTTDLTELIRDMIPIEGIDVL